MTYGILNPNPAWIKITSWTSKTIKIKPTGQAETKKHYFFVKLEESLSIGEVNAGSLAFSFSPNEKEKINHLKNLLQINDLFDESFRPNIILTQEANTAAVKPLASSLYGNDIYAAYKNLFFITYSDLEFYHSSSAY